QDGVISIQRSADGQTFVSGGGLDPGSSEGSSGKYFSVGYAVESTASGHGQVFVGHALVQILEQVKENLLEAILHGVREIHVALGEFAIGFARRAKECLHIVAEMPCQAHGSVGEDLHPLIAAEWLEVAHVEPKGAVLERNDSADLLDERVFAVGREPHHFAFIAVFLVADEFANHGVKAAERVRQEDAVENVDVVALAARHHSGNEITGAVVTEARSFFPWRAVIGAGNVSEVVLDVMFLKVELLRIEVKGMREQQAHIAQGLFALAHFDEVQNFGGIGERVLYFLGEIGIAILADCYVLDVGELRAYGVQTGLHSQGRETAVVLVAIEAFLGYGKKNLSIFDDGRRCVGVKHV